MRYYFLLLFILAATSASAQDSTVKFSTHDISFLLRGGLIYQSPQGGEVDLPPGISAANSPFLFFGNYATDAPLYHGAAYMEVGASFAKSGFSLAARLLAEHAGQSYGVYTRNAMTVYHKYLVGLDTGVTVFGYRLGVAISVGNYDNLRNQQGLTVYNMDAQGSRWQVSIDKFKVTYQKIGDMFEWIGLNIDDGNTLSYKFDSIKVIDGFYMTPEFSLFNYSRVEYSGLPMNDYGATYALRLMHTSGIAVYGEFGQRNGSGMRYSSIERSATLLGGEYSCSTSFLKLQTHAEYRNYGKAFNIGFFENNSYFDTSGTLHTLTSNRYHLGGSTLYPVQLFDRPFSQWAVFTEYQGKDVSALTFYADLTVPILYGVYFNGLLDWNKINAEGENSFVYPFYKVGFGWQPFDGVCGAYYLTNRGMNLDRAYPTLYLFKSPVGEMRITWDLKF
jgi:hypothetical protein